MRRVLDEILLGKLKALRHAPSALIHRSTLLTMTLGAIHDGL
jgi:hypothetical protein